MAQRTRNRLILFALWLAFYATFTLFTPALLDDADSVHAEVAREMLLRHDWVTLYANGIRYLEKAPLLYWSMAVSFRLFGVSTAAARLPLALTVLGLALALESFARRAFASARAGLYAALILLSSFGIFIFSRILIPDVAVCLWLTLALYAFWVTEQEPQTLGAPRLDSETWADTPQTFTLLPSLLFAASCALNIITKGLIGLVFPLGIVLIYLLLTRGWRGTVQRLRQLHPLTSLATFLLIATPWHVLIALANPTQGHPGNLAFAQSHWTVPLPTDGNVHGWAWFYFVNEQLLRYLNLRVPRDYDTVPLALFWGLMLVWLMPWSAFLPNALASALPLRNIVWRARFRSRTLTPAETTRFFLILWAALPLLFFSLSTRQEYYVLPSIPPLILLIASWLAVGPRLSTTVIRAGSKNASGTACIVSETWEDLPRIQHTSAVALVLVIVGSLAATAALILALTGTPPNPQADLAALLQQNPGDYALSFGHFFDLNRQAMGAFRTPLLLTAVALFGGTLAHYLLRKRKQHHAATLSLAAGAFLFLLAAHLGLQTFAPVLSSQRLAAALAPHLRPDDLIVIHGEYEAASTLGFYLKRNDLHILEGRSSNLWYGSFFPDAPHVFETPATLAAKWATPHRIYLWQSLTNDPGPLPLLPGAPVLVAKSGGKALYTNHPLP